MRFKLILVLALFFAAPMAEGQNSPAREAAKKRATALKDSVKASKTAVPSNVPAEAGIDRGMTAAEIESARNDTALPALKETILTKPGFGDVSSGSSSAKQKEVAVVLPIAAATAPAPSPPRETTRPPKKRLRTGLAIVKNTGRNLTPSEFATACENNDMKVLNVDCDVYAQYLHKTHPDLFGEIEDRHELAAFVRTLVLVDCYKGGARSPKPVHMARGLKKPKGNVVMDHSNSWARYIERGGKCAYSNNDDRIYFAASCWNFIEEHLSIAHLSPRDATRTVARQAPPAPPAPPAPSVVFMPPPEPLGSVETPSYKKGFPTKRVVGGLVALAVIDQALCMWVDEKFCLLRINMKQKQTQSQ